MGAALRRLFGRPPAGAAQPYAALERGEVEGAAATAASNDALERTLMRLDIQIEQLADKSLHYQGELGRLHRALVAHRGRDRTTAPPAGTVNQLQMFRKQLDLVEGQQAQAIKARLAIETILLFRAQRHTVLEVNAQLGLLCAEVKVANLAKLADDYQKGAEHLAAINNEMSMFLRAPTGAGTIDTATALGADGELTPEELAALDDELSDAEEAAELEAPAPSPTPAPVPVRPAQRPLNPLFDS